MGAAFPGGFRLSGATKRLRVNCTIRTLHGQSKQTRVN
jgi:hypothetical protein